MHICTDGISIPVDIIWLLDPPEHPSLLSHSMDNLCVDHLIETVTTFESIYQICGCL